MSPFLVLFNAQDTLVFTHDNSTLRIVNALLIALRFQEIGFDSYLEYAITYLISMNLGRVVSRKIL